MKTKFVEYKGQGCCEQCCYLEKGSVADRCSRPLNSSCAGGFYIRTDKPRKPRPSKYERLLKALLECMTVNTCDGYVQSNNRSERVMVSKNEATQLLKIKERMK